MQQWKYFKIMGMSPKSSMKYYFKLHINQGQSSFSMYNVLYAVLVPMYPFILLVYVIFFQFENEKDKG